MRLLIVYGYEPSGHASSARALEAAAEGVPGLTVTRVNISGEYHPLLGSALAHLYLKIIQKCPGLWEYLYDNPSVASATRELRRLYLFLGGRRLRAKLKELRPDLIVCTHATPMGFLASLKPACPLIGVLTDLGVHSYWPNPEVDLYLAPWQAAAESLATQGVSVKRIRVTGIPIHPAFEAPADKPAARRALGLAPDAPVVLLSGGTRGLGPLVESADALLAGLPRAQLLVLCGSNAELLAKLQGRGPRLRAYGELPAHAVRGLMAASDLLVGKAGGLTVAECLAVGLPMAFYKPIPGQEERNAAYLARRGAAVKAETLAQLVALAAGLLEPGKLAPLAARAKALGRPDAARRALNAILETAAPSSRGLTWSQGSAILNR